MGSGNCAMEPFAIWFAWCHVGSVGAVKSVVMGGCSTAFASAAVSIAFVLEALHGGAKSGHVGGVDIVGGGLEVWEYAGAGLVAFSLISLSFVVFRVGAEYADVVFVLIAVCRGLVLVRTKAVSC